MVSGLAHYHVDEPRLNENDLKTLIKYSKRIAEIGGQNQLGIVVSEDDPSGNVKIAFPKKDEQLEKYVELMINKCIIGKIKIVGARFIGNNVENLQTIIET